MLSHACKELFSKYSMVPQTRKAAWTCFQTRIEHSPAEFDCSASQVNKVVFTYTRSEYSPMLSWKEQINPNNSKNKPECIKQLFKPLNNMGFLVHQQGAKLPQQHSVMDGDAFASAQWPGSAPLRRAMHLSQYVLVCIRLGQVGGEKASFSDHMKEEFLFSL